ncbi:hypothetical protein CSAL01_05412 [Colletotrichum salicis]|uniref:Uncharacterized protein n=1 Tax=Colletotrichum salicis TaxID=1209931 RepID=A0A135RSE9_9PEZI|nr:hypothetical protein CSAL01_05412 [Colletotrichum salicis]
MGIDSTLLQLAVLSSLVVALEAAAAPTTPPNLRFAAIPLKRQATTSSGQYCGYEDNEKHGPWDCHSETCVTRGSIMGCGSSPITSCLEYDDPICSQKLEGPGNVCCTGITFPFCATGIKYITRDSIFTLKAFNCGNNQFSGVHYLVDTFSSSATSSSSSPSPPLTISSPTPVSTASSESSTATLAPTPQTEKTVPIGAIVGGAIAGLVVMGLIGGVVNTDPDYTYEAAPPRGAISEWKSPSPALTYESYKSNHQSANSGAYQHQSQTSSQSPDPTSRSGALPNGYSSNRISEVPATNPAGTGNNASELHSDYIQR